ncbi:DUF3631 domain-containing protein [Mycolicibacterium sp. CH28]|uniref:DUF3631 domain-containing protein n=1 Tax=Mycolicibacterium sp. CH28 TaxID=2512237 RepID=UPI001F253E92|nr:DUF3631 domain-containing protein [Mycolicibacterium sp. CH28]
MTPAVETDDIGTMTSGSDLLNEVRDAIRRYCVLPGEHQLVAVVLWCALSHLLTEFDYAPRLVIRSAEKRSGKSRLLEVVDALVYSPLRAVNASVAFVFRSLDEDPPPTLLFDEADTVFGSKTVSDKHEDLRGLLNAGFQRGLPFGRVGGPNLATQQFSTFAMAALAGIGRMPETIEDRAVVVVMKRRRDEETVQPYRLRRDGPMLNELRDRLAQWADTVRDRAGATYPDLPIDDRAADVWEPLISIADLAGGEWPQLARDAAVALVNSAAEDDTARSPQLQLLADIRTVFDTEFVKSDDLCRKLRALPESPWEQLELTPTRLGVRLREYSITTRHIEDKTRRGYHLVDFADAFARYLPPQEASEGVQPVQQHVEPLKEPDTMMEPITSGDTTARIEDSIGTTTASADHTSSEPLPDALDAIGHLPASQDARPSPAAMPKHRDIGAVAISQPPQRKRLRTRGRHSSGPCR